MKNTKKFIVWVECGENLTRADVDLTPSELKAVQKVVKAVRAIAKKGEPTILIHE